MPVSITIRNVPEATHEELTARAARSGRSLQEYLRAQLIELAEREDMETLMARIRERVEQSGTRFTAEEILRYRDEGRR